MARHAEKVADPCSSLYAVCSSYGSEDSVNSLTFLYDAALIIQHALHLTASHVHQPGLIHKRLPAVKACAVEQVGPNRDQKANVVLPQPCKNKQSCKHMGGRKAVVVLTFIKPILSASPALTCQIQMNP